MAAERAELTEDAPDEMAAPPVLVFEAMTEEILELMLEAADEAPEPVVVAGAVAEDGAPEVLDTPAALAMEVTLRVTPTDWQRAAATVRVFW